MKHPKMKIAIAMLAAMTACAVIPTVSRNVPCMTVSAVETTEFIENTSLVADMTVDGDLVLNADLNLNGHTLIVKGNLTQPKGILSVLDGSTLKVSGSYRLGTAENVAGSGELRMSGESLLDIGGDLIVDSTIGRSWYQSGGKIRIGGDLLVYRPDGGRGLEPSKDMMTEFVGKKQHKVYFASAEGVGLTNVSAEKGSSLYLTGETTGFTLASDLTLVGGSSVKGDKVLNLNGHTLNAAGDFIQDGTLTVNAAGSRLIVGGDYWHKHGILSMDGSTVSIKGNYELHQAEGAAGNGELRMSGTAENLLKIDGSFIVDTTVGRSWYQSTGLIQIGGDLRCYAPDGGRGLEPGNGMTLHFTGEKEHEIYFAESDSVLSNVSADAKAVLRLTGYTRGFTFASDLTFAEGSMVTGSRNMNLNGYTLNVDGDFIQDGTLTVNVAGSKLIVDGDYWHKHGILNMDDSTVSIKGNYELHQAEGAAGDGEFRMNGSAENLLKIDGSLIVDTTVGRSWYQSTGLIKVGGDLRCYAPDGGKGLEPGKSVTVEFTGRKTHDVYFDQLGSSYLSNVAVSDGGVLYLSGRTTGFKLASDVEFADGSAVRGSTTLNLDGHTVTVSGTFYQDGPTVDVNNGTFLVAGDYFVQHGILNIPNGTVNVGKNFEMHVERGIAGDSELRMSNDESKLIVGEDAVFDTTVGRSFYQGKGTISIHGNLKVYQPDNGKGLECGSGMLMEFLGGRMHEIYFDGTNSYTPALRIGIGDTLNFTGAFNGVAASAATTLTVEAPELADISGLTLTGKTAGTGKLTFDNGTNKVTNTLYVGASETEEPFSGKTVLPESELHGDVNGDGNFNIADAVLLARYLVNDEKAVLAAWKNGDFNEDGILSAVDLTMMKRALIGDQSVSEPVKSEVPEINEEDAVTVASNFNIASVTNHPTKESTFTVTKGYRLYSILTYHWNNGAGKELGKIALLEDGKQLGEWSVTGTEGQNGADNVNWWAYPENVTLQPGHVYTVVDSDPETWSQNSFSDGAGFFEIKGVPVQ